jgi:hypothetical protein
MNGFVGVLLKLHTWTIVFNTSTIGYSVIQFRGSLPFSLLAKFLSVLYLLAAGIGNTLKSSLFLICTVCLSMCYHGNTSSSTVTNMHSRVLSRKCTYNNPTVTRCHGAVEKLLKPVRHFTEMYSPLNECWNSTFRWAIIISVHLHHSWSSAISIWCCISPVQ